MRLNIFTELAQLVFIGSLLLASCTKMDHFYKDFVIERTYIGKPDSIWVQPGDNRVQIGMLKPKDVEAKKIVVNWNDGVDSVVWDIDPKLEKQFFIIDNLDERDYVFNAYTLDGLGNRSLKMELLSPVFGDNFRSNIKEISLSHSVVFPDSIAFIWNSLGQLESLYGVEFEFTDKRGDKQQIFASVETGISIIHDVDVYKPVYLKTVYRPHENAFENFFTDPLLVDFNETAKSILTFSSDGYLDAMYVDFRFVRSFLIDDVPEPVGTDIDMCYALGAGSRGNLFTMNGNGFSAFSADWQNTINQWPIRNEVEIKLMRGDEALSLYDDLNEYDRQTMVDAFNNSESFTSARLSSLVIDDVILLHSVRRKLYVAMKVLGTPPPVNGALGDFVIEFKVSRP